MDNFGFFRVAAAIPQVKVADPVFNITEICKLLQEAFDKRVSLAVFPELCVTGYTCADLFGQDFLIREAERGIAKLLEASRGKNTAILVGVPVSFRGRLYNCAVMIRNGNIKGIVPKIYLPTYGEFYENRWFSSGSDFLSNTSECIAPLLDNGKDCYREDLATIRYAGQKCNISPNLLFEIGDAVVGTEICEDLWTPIPPSSYHALAGAQVIANLSASNEVLMKHKYRKELVAQQSSRTQSGYVYCSAGWGESSQDLVYAGAACICENGTILSENERFRTNSSLIIADLDIQKLDNLRRKTSTFHSIAPDGRRSSEYGRHYGRIPLGKPADTDFKKDLFRHIAARPFVPTGDDMDYRCSEVLSIQVAGLAKRLSHINCRTAVIGISGGLDSTLALLVTVLAFDKLGWSRDRIVGVTMPGYGTTERTHSNASGLMDALGTTSREISIVGACDRHFADIGHNPEIHDVTYENSQARERTQILMDIANQTGGIVVGTGDLSELALGWATYNGDHMSMYAVNASIPKTLVKHLVKWTAENRFSGNSENDKAARRILLDIVDTPISPELLPADENGNISQVTEDLVGPYELHDFFLYHFFRFGYHPAKLQFLAEKAFKCGEQDEIYDKKTVSKWLKVFMRRFFNQQFKRSCLPDGPKVGTVTLSPRGDWRMPSDAAVPGPDSFWFSGHED